MSNSTNGNPPGPRGESSSLGPFLAHVNAIQVEHAPARRLGERLLRKSPQLALWRIDGHEAGDSSGGSVTILVLTAGVCLVPDVHAAIDDVSEGRYSFYMLDAIRRVACIEDLDIPNGCLYDDVANQTGLSMDRKIANAIAGLIIESIQTEAARDSHAREEYRLSAQQGQSEMDGSK
jgi:hypothetical protein